MGYTNLNILKMDTGSHEGTWGTQTNYNWDRIDSYVSGYKDVALSGADPTHTIDTTQDATPSEATGDGWNAYLNFSGSPSGAGTITIAPPSKTKIYFVRNSTGIVLTFKYASESGVTLAAGASTVLLADGTNVVKALNVLEAATVNADLIGSATIGSGEKLEVSGGGTIKIDGAYPTGSNNSVIGELAGNALLGGAAYNVLYGYKSGYAITTGDGNVCVGYQSGNTLSTTSGNTFLGHQAGELSIGAYNVGVGLEAISGIGTGTGDSNYNSGFGVQAGANLTSGNLNTYIGYHSGKEVTTGIRNVGVGNSSGKSSNRSKCIFLGDSAGSFDVGADSILVIDNEAYAATADQEIYQFIWGDIANNRLNFNSQNSSGSHVKIQNSNAASSGFQFLQCYSDTASSAELKFQITGEGNVTADGTYTSPAADYADMFEWSDGNPEGEDRIGLTVVIDETSEEGGVRPATSSDDPNDVIGTVSGTACVIGNAAWKGWDKKYLKDDFGRTVTTSVDENVTPVLNPEYDEGREYVPRMARPDWAVIGLTGRIHIRKGALTHPSWRKIKNVSAVTEEWLVR